VPEYVVLLQVKPFPNYFAGVRGRPNLGCFGLISTTDWPYARDDCSRFPMMLFSFVGGFIDPNITLIFVQYIVVIVFRAAKIPFRCCRFSRDGCDADLTRNIEHSTGSFAHFVLFYISYLSVFVTTIQRRLKKPIQK
jgi:hypothetical protein